MVFLYALPTYAATVEVSVPESYALVRAGERVYFETDIAYPEDIGRHDLRIKYSIWEGNKVIASGESYQAIETEASFTEYAIVPEDAKQGLHTVQVTVYDDQGNVLAQDAFTSFTVAAQFNWLLFYFLILLSAIVLMGIVLSIEVYRIRRDLHTHPN